MRLAEKAGRNREEKAACSHDDHMDIRGSEKPPLGPGLSTCTEDTVITELVTGGEMTNYREKNYAWAFKVF